MSREKLVDDEDVDLSQIPEGAIMRIAGHYHQRELDAGQTGVKKVVLESMHVSYRVILEDGHEFIDQGEGESDDLSPLGMSILKSLAGKETT